MLNLQVKISKFYVNELKSTPSFYFLNNLQLFVLSMFGMSKENNLRLAIATEN